MPIEVYIMGRSVVNFKGVIEVDTTVYWQITVCHVIILYVVSWYQINFISIKLIKTV